MEYLHRLPSGFYIGEQAIHWTMGIQDRRVGWLDERSHAGVREALLHTAFLYPIEIPAYCLMPDHAHFLIVGLSGDVDQRAAVKYFRRLSNAMLHKMGFSWQKQPYDHVLTEEERAHAAFQKVSQYVVENAWRKKLSPSPGSWPFASSLIPGYPWRSWRDVDFWEFFWNRGSRRK